MATSDLFLRALKSFVVSMKSSYDINEMAYELSRGIAEALAVTGAGVSVADMEGKLRFVAATDERIVQIERAQEAAQVGPCVSAFHARQAVSIRDIQEMDDWPAYKTAAVQLGLRSVVGYPIGDDLGAIDVYHEEKREWDDDDLEVIEVFADMANAYLVRVAELLEQRLLANQLQNALDSRVIIEQAKGMLAQQHEITVDEAFERLRRHSQNNNIKLVEVCRAVVDMELDISSN